MSGNDMNKLFADAEAKNAFPFWTMVEDVRPNEPEPRSIAHVWQYKDMKALLERAGDLVVGEDAAERRVFILANPGFDARHTTDGVLAAVQLIHPGELAPSHRHTASAIRFVIEGSGAYTQVGGELVHMEPGDLVLTPSRRYHDHGNDGTDPVFWLDALDLPLFHMLPANFSNPYSSARYPAVENPQSPILLRWADMRGRLDAAESPVVVQQYCNPTNGGPILRNLRASAIRIAPGAAWDHERETASGVYQVVSGAGATRVGDRELRWEQGDTFAVPAWQRYSHSNTGPEAAYLFRIDEKPALESLGMYVTESTLRDEAP